MDSGLSVRWPLSPFVTALAVGALFALCIALWRQRSDPKQKSGRRSGQKIASDGKSDSTHKADEDAISEESVPKRCWILTGGFSRHMLPRATDTSRQWEVNRFSGIRQYRGFFGPRPAEFYPQDSRIHLPQSLFPFAEPDSWKRAYRRLYRLSIEKSNIHGIRSGLKIEFLLNIFPRPVIRHFCELRCAIPRAKVIGEGASVNFRREPDVSIHPRILRDRPITRAAITFALENELHSIIREYSLPESGVRPRSLWAVNFPEDWSADRQFPESHTHFTPDNPTEEISKNLLDFRSHTTSNKKRIPHSPFIYSENGEITGFESGTPNILTKNIPDPNNERIPIFSEEEPFTEIVTRAPAVDNPQSGEEEESAISDRMSFQNLEAFQKAFDNGERESTPPKSGELSFLLETRCSVVVQRGPPDHPPESSEEKERGEGGFRVTLLDRDVSEREGEGVEATSRTRTAADREVPSAARQMDRRTREKAVDCAEPRVFESTITSETQIHGNGDARFSSAVVSRITLDEWSTEVDTRFHDEGGAFRPTFEEFVPVQKSPLDQLSDALQAPPRVSRLIGLLNRDEERRARAQMHPIRAEPPSHAASIESEWDRLLRDVLASVSELEHWEENEQRRRHDVSDAREDAEEHPRHQSHCPPAMEEEEALSPKGETPTKVRFKLDPDVFDVPSDDSFYDEDDEDTRRAGWRRQPKYRAFSSLELSDEPVRLVSVHASVVPAGQKMVARPVGIDLRVRLTEERQSKRAHVGTSPSQAKRRSPVSDRGVGWCQELSPVTENVDWRETFTAVPHDHHEFRNVPNGILKTPSPKAEPPPPEDSVNPFRVEENGSASFGTVSEKRVEKLNGGAWKPTDRKPFTLLRKKFEPDPEAIERITGYKTALSKPPLPPPVFPRVPPVLPVRNRAEQMRKQYLDSKASLAASKVDGTRKFQQFLAQAQSDRARIVTSVPDLGAIERAVTEQWAKERASASPRASPARDDSLKSDDVPPSRGSTPDDAWASYVQSCRQHLGRRSQSLSYLETDVDIPVLEDEDKCRSVSALDEPDSVEVPPVPDDSDFERSHEDLEDSGRAKSEHELRVERSLRSLPVPDWYRHSEKPKTGFLLGSVVKEKRGWAAAKSLASSTSSLASCGLRRPVRSLRSSRENIPWSRSSASPDGPALSLALAKAFREPYLGWRARTPTSSGVSSSPRASPPSWGAGTTDDEVNGVSFDGEDAFGRTSSEEDRRDEPPSLDDTGADAVTVSMDTGDPVKLPGGEDTCDDINNMSMDTCELFDASVMPEADDPSPQADTGDDIDNLSTDTTDERRKDSKSKRYSYSQSIYHSEWEEEESRGDRKVPKEEREASPSSENKVIWIESSFVGSRTTTSIVVLPDEKVQQSGSSLERPASR